MNHFSTSKRKAFSLIELVIVVVIIGIIAAIAIPKMSRGSAGAADSAFQGNLAVLRNAIELYYSEHGTFPTGTGAEVAEKLTKVTNASGTVGAKNVANGFIYGPYLRKVPTLGVGSATKRNLNTIKVVATSTLTPASADAEAWLYSSESGEIIANLDSSETPTGSTTAYNAM